MTAITNRVPMRHLAAQYVPIRVNTNQCFFILHFATFLSVMYVDKYCKNCVHVYQGWGQVQLTKYSSTPSTPNIYQVQVLVKYSFFYKVLKYI